MQTRADVQGIKDHLDKGLAALASAVTGNQTFAAKQLDDLKPFVLPLLASPLVGEGSAYDAAYGLARCLPGALHDAAFAVASALQMVVQSRQEGMQAHSPQTPCPVATSPGLPNIFECMSQKKKNKTKKFTSFGVRSTRSLVIYQAAQTSPTLSAAPVLFQHVNCITACISPYWCSLGHAYLCSMWA